MQQKQNLKSEKDVKREVRKLLKAHSWTAWMPARNAYGGAGMADILALRSGVFLAIETKFGSNKLRPTQVKFLREVLAEDSFAFVVSEKDLDQLASWFAAFDAACHGAEKGETVEPEHIDTMQNAIQSMTRRIMPDEKPSDDTHAG